MVESADMMSVRLWRVIHAQKQKQNPPNERKMAKSAENIYAIKRKKNKSLISDLRSKYLWKGLA